MIVTRYIPSCVQQTGRAAFQVDVALIRGKWFHHIPRAGSLGLSVLDHRNLNYPPFNQRLVREGPGGRLMPVEI